MHFIIIVAGIVEVVVMMVSTTLGDQLPQLVMVLIWQTN